MSDAQRPDGAEEENPAEVIEIKGGGRVLKSIPVPPKGAIVILTHDSQDGMALLGTLVRSANMLTALLAAMDAAQTGLTRPAPDAAVEEVSVYNSQLTLSSGASFLALQHLMMHLYPEGAARLIADINGLRNMVMNGAPDGNVGAAASVSTQDVVDALARASAAAGQQDGGSAAPAETGTGTGEGEPLFIPKTPRAVS